MVDYAEAEFALGREMDDGCTYRQHLETAWQATGKQPEELADKPDLPPGTRYLMDIFYEIRRRSNGGGFGPARMTFQDFAAWEHMKRMRLENWEQTALEAIDDAYINWVNEQDKAKRK